VKYNAQTILKIFLSDGYIKENQSPGGNFALGSLRTQTAPAALSVLSFLREK